MMRKLCLLMLLFSFSFSARSQLPCSDPVYRQFDFWIGEWEAFGKNGNKAGDSKIELVLDSCVIVENWTSATITRGLRYSGKSYNSWNATTKKWQQYFVDNTGGAFEYFNGRFEDGKIILETANIQQPDKSYKIMRMTFYKLGSDKVRQLGENSTDGGKSWQTSFDLEYRRRK